MTPSKNVRILSNKCLIFFRRLFMTLYTAIITLILVMDPLGNIPIFLAILNKVDPKRRQWIIFRETFIAFIILTAFLFFGETILNGMNVSNPALSMAGGIILFLIAIKMIFPHEENQDQYTKQTRDPFIVPLAVPFIAGPSTMALVMLLAKQEPAHIWTWMSALFIAWL